MTENALVPMPEGTEVSVLDAVQETGQMMAAIQSGLFDKQITTAKAFPRSLSGFLEEAEMFATLDEDTAATMFYNLPRAGKQIEGPSVRLAEIAVSAWGNCRVDTGLVGIGEKFVTVYGRGMDFQKNVTVEIQVQRKITNKDGKRFNDDMINVTTNAAMSIAYRQVAFKIVPAAFIGSIYRKAKKVAVGDASTLVIRRQKMVEWFGKVGIMPERVYDSLEVRGIDDITLEHLGTLIGIANAIKAGDVEPEAAFSLEGTEETAKTADLNRKLSEKQEEEQEEQAEQADPPAADTKDPVGAFHAALDEHHMDGDEIIDAFARARPDMPDTVEEWQDEHYAKAAVAVRRSPLTAFCYFVLELADNPAVAGEARDHLMERMNDEGYTRTKANNDVARLNKIISSARS